MTKADPLEEPCAGKLACTVLQTSGGSNPFAEFNTSHQPTRQRERRMQRFKSPGQAQRFLSAYGPIAQHFRPRRHRFSAPVFRQELGKRFQIWREITVLALAA
jgi:transposase-like protein